MPPQDRRPRRPPPRRPASRRPRAPRKVTRRERSGRIRALVAIAVVMLGLLGLRAAYLGTVEGGELAAKAVSQNRVDTQVLAQRGSILASDGSDLATDRLAVDVTASPNLITDPGGVAARLAPIIRRDPNTLANTLSKPGLYAMLARNVAPADADRARKLGIPGIYFSDTYQRFLPGTFLASQLVGLTGDTHQGISGMEQELDTQLTGTPGRRVEVRDVFGRPIQVLADKEPNPGTDVTLTIDPAIQAEVESVLAQTREKYQAKSAEALVMDPQTGAVLAMATVPRFNPNKRETINPELERNRPVTDTFEPGSTFKIVTMAGALEDGKVTPTTSLNLPVVYKLYDRTLRDSHERGPITLTASEILEQSSNIGTVMIARRLTQARLQAWITRFGFGSPTGIDYPGEVKGLVLPAVQWSGTSILNIPIGQGVGVTLTQLTRAYAAIANGGRLVTPYLVKSIDGQDVPAKAGRRIMSETTANKVDKMLRKVVSSDGTGIAAKVRGYKVAGKTGTAQIIDPTTGEYSKTAYKSSFVGYAPAGNPHLLVSVMVDQPTTGSYYGGDVAAPAFESIAQFSLQRLRIAP